MSYPWMLVRGASSNPSSLKFAALMNKQSIAENELFKPERQQPIIISAHMEDWILVQDPFTFKKLKYKTRKYYAPWEPDGVYLTYWCRFNHIARQMTDLSCKGNVTYPHGYPKLCEGPDDGVKGGTIVSRINSNPDIIDYYSTPEAANIKTAGTTGFSIYLAFIVEQQGSVDGGLDATLQYKYDDSNNYRIIVVRADGTLAFQVRIGGADFSYTTAANAITPNQLYRCCFTYNPTGNVQVMRINNVVPADTANNTFTAPSGTTDMVHGKRGSSDNGRIFARMIESRFYNGLIFNNDMMDNIWNNGRSICATDAIFFDGTNDFIDCGNDSSLWSTSLTKFSFSFWIYPTLAWDGTVRDIVKHGWSSNQAFLVSFHVSTSGRIEGFIKDSGGNTTSCRSDSVTLNKWNYITFVYDNSLGSANLKIYVNGVVGSVTGNETDSINLSASLVLGDGTTDFQGYMKDFRFWKTTALSEAEVIKVRDNRPDAPTPSYWLKMVEGNGNPVDFITRTKVGTLTNGALWKIWSSNRPTEFGSLAVAGYTKFNDILDAGGYDSTGYDSTGFDTT